MSAEKQPELTQEGEFNPNAPVVGYVVVQKLDDAVDFYSKVFGAKEHERYEAADKVWHAQMGLYGNRLLLMESMPDMELVARPPETLVAAGGDSSMLSLDVPNVDDTYKRAIEAGATPLIEPYDAHWGDRYAEFRDPFAHRWSCCTAQRHLLPVDKQASFRNFVEPRNLTSPAPAVPMRPSLPTLRSSLRGNR